MVSILFCAEAKCYLLALSSTFAVLIDINIDTSLLILPAAKNLIVYVAPFLALIEKPVTM